MTYSEKAQAIGQETLITFGNMRLRVEILDYKNSYGKDRWLVTPISGTGKTWVEKVITK